MKNPFKEVPLNVHELVKWKKNSLINPRTNKSIKEDGGIYKLIKTAYNLNKIQVDILINKQENQTIESIPESNKNNFMILKCNEDRDLISMNLFWVEENKIRKIVYPEEKLDQLIFYTDSKNIVRGFEKETIRYLRTYNITNHPITTEPIPEYVLAQVELVNITQNKNARTLQNVALDVFQYFSKISIFINHEAFLSLSKIHLIKFNYEVKDFWLKNFSSEQRKNIHDTELFKKSDEDLRCDSLENIQKYLLGQMEILLKCNVEKYKYMINYIILGALGVVIPQIKEMYPDFLFSFC